MIFVNLALLEMVFCSVQFRYLNIGKEIWWKISPGLSWHLWKAPVRKKTVKKGALPPWTGKNETFVVWKRWSWYQKIHFLAVWAFSVSVKFLPWNWKSTPKRKIHTNWISLEHMQTPLKVDGLTSILQVCIVHFIVFWGPGRFGLQKVLGYLL